MGFITKRMFRGQTRRITEPMRVATKLEPEDVVEIAEALVGAFVPRKVLGGTNAHLYFVEKQPWYFQYGMPSAKDPAKLRFQRWLAKLDIAAAEDASQHLVTIQLVEWRERDGQVEWRQDFEGLRSRLHAAISDADPTARVLTG